MDTPTANAQFATANSLDPGLCAQFVGVAWAIVNPSTYVRAAGANQFLASDSGWSVQLG